MCSLTLSWAESAPPPPTVLAHRLWGFGKGEPSWLSAVGPGCVLQTREYSQGLTISAGMGKGKAGPPFLEGGRPHGAFLVSLVISFSEQGRAEGAMAPSLWFKLLFGI